MAELVVEKESVDTSVKGDRQIDVGVASQPDWLLTPYEDTVWKFKEETKGYSKSHFTVSWEYTFSKSIADRSSYWTSVAKQAVCLCMSSDKTKCNKTNSLVNYARELRVFCFWLCGERNCLDLESVSVSDIRAYEKYIEGQFIAVNSVVSKLIVVQLLWTLRLEMGHGLSFNPYMRSGSLQRKAKQIGIVGGHTPTILPNDLFSMINCALETLCQSEELLGKLELYLDLDKRYVSTSKVFKRQTGMSSKILADQLRVLYGAALFIKLLLTAERKHELAYTKYVDVMALLGGHCDELRGTVTKTSKTAGGKATSRPVVKELLQALQVIVDLTRGTRIDYEGDALFLKLPIKSGGCQVGLELAQSAVYFNLDAFVNKASEGKVKILRPHMLRRAFSMMWTWRFEVGDLHHLSKMLYHNSEAFTKAYTEDDDVLEFLPEAEKALMYDILEKSLLGGKVIRGSVGRTMKRYGRILQAVVTVISPEAVHRFVDSMVKRRDYKLVPQADGFCLIDRAREKYARCSTDGQTPNYANRSDEMCVKCVNFGVTEDRKPVWEKRKLAFQAVSNSTDVEILKRASLAGVERAETVIKWINQDD